MRVFILTFILILLLTMSVSAYTPSAHLAIADLLSNYCNSNLSAFATGFISHAVLDSIRPQHYTFDIFNPDVILMEPWSFNQKMYLDINSLKSRFPQARFVVLTRQVSLDKARQVMARGAFDFMIKPCPVEDLLAVIQRAANVRY